MRIENGGLLCVGGVGTERYLEGCRRRERRRLAKVQTTRSSKKRRVMERRELSQQLARVKRRLERTMVGMTTLRRRPRARSLWWMWFLSGRKGLTRLRMRWR